MVFAAAAASASPGNAAATGRYRQHPPYKEMILNAIGTLKERGGSSRRAISKFIGDTYSDLPPTHSALLGHHLRRLKNKGVLRMVKNSYKLSATVKPVSPNASPAPAPRPRGRPPKKLPAPPPKQKPKSKAKANAAPTLAKRKPGRPPKAAKVAPAAAGEKRKRGRPPKSATPSVLPKRSNPVKARAAAPDGKRKPGRPRKNTTVAAAVPNVNAAPSGERPKRGRGRPKKAAAPSLPKPAKKSQEKAAGADEAAVPVVKRRGRPPKKINVAAVLEQVRGQAATGETQESAPEA
ncbi:HMG-Y-related protein A [Cocos nucifera]|nr:HMG-Y-related protein A [Cocos nucifera]